MNKWTTQIDNYKLDNLTKRGLELLSIIKENNEDFNELEELARLEYTYNYFDLKFSYIDPFLNLATLIGELSGHLSQNNTEFEHFINNKNIGHLQNANSRVDSILRILSNMWFPTEDKEEMLGISEATSAYHKMIEQFTSYIKSQHEESRSQIGNLQVKLNELVNVVDQQKSRLDNFISSTQEQFNRSEESRSATFITAENQRRDQATTTMELRKQYFENQMEEIHAKYEDLFGKMQTNTEKLVEQITDNGKGYVDCLEELKAKAENLVNVIGNTGMSGGYQKVANSEASSKTIWRSMSVGSLLLLVVLLGIDFYINKTATFTIEDVIRRLTITAALGTLSTYTARQASKHEEAERYNRRMELELSSLDLYLTGIPEATTIKKAFTDKFFGNEFKVSQDKDNELPNLTKSLSEIAASVQQFMKKDNRN